MVRKHAKFRYVSFCEYYGESCSGNDPRERIFFF